MEAARAIPVVFGGVEGWDEDELLSSERVVIRLLPQKSFEKDL